MPRRFQFSLRNALMTTGIAAVFIAPVTNWNGATITISFVVLISLVQCWLAMQD